MAVSEVIKLITTGDGGVGKTTLLHKYVDGKFLTDTKMTIGVDFYINEIDVDGHNLMLQLWDFTGQTHLRYIVEKYVLGAKGALFLFDLTGIGRTLRAADDWLRIINSQGEIPTVLVGAKYDLIEEDKSQYDFNKSLIFEIKDNYDFIEYIECSSKTGYNIEEPFKILAREILKSEIL